MRYAMLLLFAFTRTLSAQIPHPEIRLVGVADGWANNSINAVIFRKNALVTHQDTQFIAFYDPEGWVTLGKRKQGEIEWQIEKTPHRGNVADAHNSISLMVDGAGYLHLAWDHHNHPLRYCRSVRRGALKLSEKIAMTGRLEQSVSYPEFYRLADGNLLFLYRTGESGRGNLVINRYDTASQEWTQLHSNLIDGQDQRNAYWQACTDAQGQIHLSWVWRESPDVASNHDLCYARSRDGGLTWEKSSGERYILPITAATAEYACRIPPDSELINQTSMTADAEGNPYISTYWRDPDSRIPQYRLVYCQGGFWKTNTLKFRKTPFSLSGTGTKSIPISRPQVVVFNPAKTRRSKLACAVFFRDEERGSRVSAAVCRDLRKGKWRITDLTEFPVGSWEPTYDSEWWIKKGIVHLFVQKVVQIDGEGVAKGPPQVVQVLEWDLNH